MPTQPMRMQDTHNLMQSMHGHVSKRSLTIRDVSKYSLTVVSAPLLYETNVGSTQHCCTDATKDPPFDLGRGAVVGGTPTDTNL
jgi:hypothetical protein